MANVGISGKIETKGWKLLGHLSNPGKRWQIVGISRKQDGMVGNTKEHETRIRLMVGNSRKPKASG